MSPGRDGFGVFDMGTFGPVHWIVVAVLVLLLFGGRGKLSGIMGDAAKGVRAFREGLKGEEEEAKVEEPAKPLPKTAARTRSSAKTKANS
jgi:sec-independent protein translocase protein TatA